MESEEGIGYFVLWSALMFLSGFLLAYAVFS